MFLYNFGTFIPCSDIYFLEVSAHVFEHNILVAIGGSEWEVNWKNRIISVPREDIILKL